MGTGSMEDVLGLAHCTPLAEIAVEESKELNVDQKVWHYLKEICAVTVN